MSNPSVQCKITKDRTVVIQAVKPNIALETPIFAVNWLKASSPLIYKIYNLLAGPMVLKIGGIPLFKGQVTKKITGLVKDERPTFLLVKYPSANHFKTLVESSYFKVVSLLRIKAVAQFDFAFTQPVESKAFQPTKDKALSYLVHHAKSSVTPEQLSVLLSEAHNHNIQLFYAGGVAAKLIAQQKGQANKTVPFPFTTTLLWFAQEEQVLSQFVMSDAYQQAIGRPEEDFLAFLDREL